MNDQLRKTVEKFYKEYLRKKRWKKAVNVMGCVVVFCTTYALILPAITMQKDTICGYEEHLHGEECYISAPTVEMICTAETLGVHEHDNDCYDDENELICGQADFIIHEHDDDCYWEDELLLCTLDEVEEHTHSKKKCYDIYEELVCGQEETGHFHGEACYASERGELICGKEEYEGHSHSSSCYEIIFTEETERICDLPEDENHNHDEGCYETTVEEEKVLICTEEQTEGHSHRDNCYEWNKYLTCTREEVDGHIHDDSCYVTVEELDCDKEEIEAHEHDEDCDDCKKLETIEHQHSEACFRELAEEEIGEPILICKEKQHQHTDDCYPKETELVFVCELMEHCHEDFCYDTEGNLICEITEHSHDDSCYEEVEIGGEPGGADKEIEGEPDETDKPDNSDGTESPTEGETEGTVPEEPPVTDGETGGKAPEEDSEIEEMPPAEGSGTEVLPPAENEQKDSEINSSGGSNHSSNKDKDRDDHKDETIEEPTKETEGEDTEGDQTDMKDDPEIKEDGEVEVPEDDPADPETQEPQENPMFPVFPEEEPVKQPEVEINGLQKHEHGEDCYDEEGNLSCTIQDVITEPEEEITKEELEEIEIPTLSEFAQMGNIESYLQDQMGNLRFRILNGTGEELMPDEMGVYFVDTETEYSLHVGILAPQGFEEGSYFYQLPEGVNSETGNGVLMIEEVEVGNWVVTDSGYITFFMNQEAKKYWDVSISIDFEICFEPGVEECQIGDLVFAVETIIDISDRTLSASVSSAEINVVVPEGVYIPEGAYLAVTELPKDSREWEAAVSTAEETYEDSVLDGYIYEILICDAEGNELTELSMEEVEISIVLNTEQDYNVMYQPVQIFSDEVVEAEVEEPPMEEEKAAEEVEAEESGLVESAFTALFTTAWAMETESDLEARLVDDADVTETKDNVMVSFAGQARTVAVLAMRSSLNYQVNTQKDAFLKDSAYSIYYNANSPLGTAGSFHVVGFDTVSLHSHTNGNILAKTLRANGQAFGTNNYNDELSYIQSYESVSGNTGSKENHYLVLGTNNIVGTADNGSAFSVNNEKLNTIKNIVQDEDTIEKPFIDLERVENEIRGLSSSLAEYKETGLTKNLSAENDREVVLNNPNAVGVWNMTAEELTQLKERPLRLKGFRSDGSGSIVINVNCAGATNLYMPSSATVFIDGEEQSTNEVVEFSAGKVIWNFINAEGVTITLNKMTGMVVAPGATVVIDDNVNGTVVAENVQVMKESHRTDFTGKIELTPAEAQFSLKKVDSENINITLPKAIFELHEYNPETGEYDILAGTYSSSKEGDLANNAVGWVHFTELKYNQAYKLQEVTAPAGYILGDEPQYFLLPHADTTNNPVVKPANYTGKTEPPGAVLVVTNVASDEEGNYELPSTGGMGTHWFILGGLTMMFGAGALIIKKQRSKSEENS